MTMFSKHTYVLVTHQIKRKIRGLNTLKGWTLSLGGIVGAEVVLAPLGVVHMWLQCFGIYDINAT